MKNIEIAKQHLISGNYTCVLLGYGKLHTSTQRGVKPLVEWFETENDFSGCSAADKVIGKATAFLYILLGIKEVYANVISIPALKVLTENGVEVEYSQLVENIINRQGNGICPFESAVIDVNNPETAYTVIRNKMAEMNIEV